VVFSIFVCVPALAHALARLFPGTHTGRGTGRGKETNNVYLLMTALASAYPLYINFLIILDKTLNW